MWEGGECWIIGGGPSMPRQFGVPEEVIQSVHSRQSLPNAYSSYMAAIHNKHIIGINSAFLIGDWIDIVFFGDKHWFFDNRQQLAKFPGLKITCHSNLGSEKYKSDQIKYLPRAGRRGISRNNRSVCWNHNSGAAAISVAVHMGCSRIILLGFDMKLDRGGAQHWHSLYKVEGQPRKQKKFNMPFDRHLIGFPYIAKDAKRFGVEIINACPDSAITDFPKMTVKQILERVD